MSDVAGPSGEKPAKKRRHGKYLFMRQMRMTAIYELKIIVRDSKPMIWRRVQVPREFNFDELHITIQEIMGWNNCHSFAFHTTQGAAIKKKKFGDHLNKENDSVIYDYDNGFWIHDVVLTKILPVGPKTQYPKAISGSRACPPENIHGPEQYAHQLKVLKNPKHEEYADLRSWYDDYAVNFDSEHFDASEVTFARLGLVYSLMCNPK